MLPTFVLGNPGRGAQRKPRETLRKRTTKSQNNLARRSGRSRPCGATLRDRADQVPAKQPCDPFRTTLQDGAGDQVPAEQPCEAERTTKSLLNNLATRSRRPGPYRATSRGGTGDRVPAEQPREAEQMIKSLSSNLARRSGRLGPCRATLPKGRAIGSHASLTSVREGRPNDVSPRQRDKTGHHQTTPRARVQRRKVPDEHQMTPRYILSHAKPPPTSGASQSHSKGSQHQSLPEKL